VIVYVAGFMFNERRDVLALIEKKRPVWQAGRLNAIGGHVEKGETPAEAMRREFLEEAGVDYNGWEQTVHLIKPGYWEVYFFRAFTNDVLEVVSQTDEQVKLVTVHDAKNSPYIIDNLRWLIPMQLDSDLEWRLPIFERSQHSGQAKDDEPTKDDRTVVHPNRERKCSKCGRPVVCDAFIREPLCIDCIDEGDAA